MTGHADRHSSGATKSRGRIDIATVRSTIVGAMTETEGVPQVGTPLGNATQTEGRDAERAYVDAKLQLFGPFDASKDFNTARNSLIQYYVNRGIPNNTAAALFITLDKNVDAALARIGLEVPQRGASPS